MPCRGAARRVGVGTFKLDEVRNRNVTKPQGTRRSWACGSGRRGCSATYTEGNLEWAFPLVAMTDRLFFVLAQESGMFRQHANRAPRSCGSPEPGSSPWCRRTGLQTKGNSLDRPRPAPDRPKEEGPASGLRFAISRPQDSVGGLGTGAWNPPQCRRAASSRAFERFGRGGPAGSPRYSQTALSRKQPVSHGSSALNRIGSHHGSKVAIRPPASVTS